MVGNLKVAYWGLINDCSERGGMEGGQKRELRTKKAKLLLECTEKKKEKIVASK
jgi:hypothetical protein